ncbi:MAG: PAS domain S-box protein [Promethearchaeota archaeon]
MTVVDKKLKESEERFKALFKGGPVPTYAWQKVGGSFRLIDFNYAAEKITGGNVERFLGISASEMYKNRPDIIKDLNRTFDEQTNFIREMKYSYSISEEEKDLLVTYSFITPDLVLVHTEDITARKNAEIKLRESEEKFRSLVETTSDWIWEVDNKGVYTYSNPKVRDMLGYEVEEVIGKTAFDLMPSEEAELILELFQKAVEKKESIVGLRNNVIHKKGFHITLETSGVPFFDKDGTLLGYRGIDRDISEQLEAERKLKESEELYRSLTEGLSNTGIGIDIVDSNYRIIYQNQYLKEQFGKHNNQLCYEFYLRQENSCDNCPMIKAIQNKKVEKELITAPNNRTYEIIAAPLPNPDGKIERAAEVVIDITDRIESEQKLKESEEKYRSLFNNMNAGFAYHKVITDEGSIPVDYEYIEVNPAFEKFTGLKAEDMIGKRVTEILPGTENDPADWIGKFGKVGLTGIPLIVEDYSEALDRWYRVSGYSPKKGYFAVTFTEITDQKKIELKLIESEEKYRKLFNDAPFAIVLFNMDGDILDCNNATSIVTGYLKDDLIGKNFRDINLYVDPESAAISEIEMQVKIGKLPLPREILLKKKDGSEFWAKSQIEFVNLGEKKYIQAIIQDISEEKRAEIRLKESELKFRDLFEEAPIAYFSVGTDKTIIRCNKAAERLLGYSTEEFLKMKILDLYSDSSQGKERAKEIFNRFLDGKDIKDVELQMKKKQGDNIWVSLSVKPILDLKGNVIESRSIVLDINERKLAQEEVKKSYQRLEELEYIINNSPGIVFLWKNSEGWPVEYVSENVTQFGYITEDFYSGKVIYEELIHPDDVQRVAKEVEIHSNDGSDEFAQEYRIVTKSGKMMWLDDRTWIRRDQRGNITHFEGIVLDITKRKNADEALKLSEKSYREAFDRANFYKDLFAHDMNNILQVVNSSAELISFQLGDSEKSKDLDSITKIIKNQVERGSKLISNVRILSELEEQEINTKKFDIRGFIENSVKFVKRAYGERKLKISFDYANGTFIADTNELLQDVFENVLINGIKYNENFRVEIDIRVSKQIINETKYIKIEFIDNGIGVVDERKDLIFMRGNRELKGSKGMGLGLSLVSKILEIFKGKIWVEDRINGDYRKGSNFIIILPDMDK